MYTYGDLGTTKIDSVTENPYLGDSVVHRHHHIIWNTQSVFPSSWSHALLPSFHRSRQFVSFLRYFYQAFKDPSNLCGSVWLCIPVYPHILVLCSSSRSGSWGSILFGYYARCGRVLMMGCRPYSSTISPHRDQRNFEMHSKAVFEWLCRCTLRTWSTELRGSDHVSLEICLEAVIEWVHRCTWRM